MTASIWEIAARKFEKPALQWETPGQLAQALDPRTMQTKAMDVIDEALTWAWNTPDARLMIAMSPQMGKSQRAVRRFTEWVLTQNPNTRVTICSYNTDTARRWGRTIRDDINEHGDQLGLSIRNDVAAQSEWILEGHEGGVFTAGVGSSLTGRPSDCISGDTYIECEYGEITAELAFKIGIQWIRAYDHTTGKPVWRKVEAARRIPSRPVVEVITQSGRALTCTPDHRVYTSRGYMPAGSLRDGETLLGLVGHNGMRVRGDLGNPENGCPESNPQETQAVLLRELRQGRNIGNSEIQNMHSLWRASAEEWRGNLLQGMLGCSQSQEAQGKGLPSVWPDVQVQQHPEGLLLSGVCGSSALDKDDREEQFPFQRWHELRKMVQNHASANSGARWESVRGVQASALHGVRSKEPASSTLSADYSSPERKTLGQRCDKLDYAVSGMPYDAPQIESDTVSMVRSVDDGEISVYDFQVEGTRNFFGNGVLVHNCMIIDDPVKGREDADSERYQERNWDWWREVAMTRLAPGAPVILIQTRWSIEDLAGKVLKPENGGGEWRVVSIPAQADHRPELGETDPLGREPGEWMETTRGMTPAQWERRKRDTGPRSWAALYQQKPTPDEGGIFPREWATYDEPMWIVKDDGTHWIPGMDRDDHEMLMSGDLTFSDSKNSDYVALQVWLRVGHKAYLLDQVRRRMNFNDTCEAILAMRAKWPQVVATLIENAANGPAVINALQKQIYGLIPVEPLGSKSARASAVSPLAFSKDIVLPTARLLPNVEDLREELVNFPSKHDDTVDALSQAVNQLLLHRIDGHGDGLEQPEDYDLLDERGWLLSPY